MLTAVGEVLNYEVREKQKCSAGRYGGEEFLVFKYDTNIEDVLQFAEDLRKEVEKLSFKSEKQKQFSITISIGVAQGSSMDTTVEQPLNRADQALYEAKERGRNRIVIYNEK